MRFGRTVSPAGPSSRPSSAKKSRDALAGVCRTFRNEGPGPRATGLAPPARCSNASARCCAACASLVRAAMRRSSRARLASSSARRSLMSKFSSLKPRISSAENPVARHRLMNSAITAIAISTVAAAPEPLVLSDDELRNLREAGGDAVEHARRGGGPQPVDADRGEEGDDGGEQQRHLAAKRPDRAQEEAEFRACSGAGVIEQQIAKRLREVVAGVAEAAQARLRSGRGRCESSRRRASPACHRSTPRRGGRAWKPIPRARRDPHRACARVLPGAHEPPPRRGGDRRRRGRPRRPAPRNWRRRDPTSSAT